MNENTLQLISGIKLLLVAVFAMLYGMGGISGKYKRRFIAPAVYIAGIVGVSLWTRSFSYWYVSSLFVFFFSLSIGYGGTVTTQKMIKRGRYGLANALATLPMFIVAQAWTLLALHIAVCTATSIVAGTWNQTSSARTEETLIGAVIVLIPILTI